MKCHYQLADGDTCGAEICLDSSSYSGYSHNHKADWCHWASPTRFGLGETIRIFVPCTICGKLGSDKRHIEIAGHKFQASTEFGEQNTGSSCSAALGPLC